MHTIRVTTKVIRTSVSAAHACPARPGADGHFGEDLCSALGFVGLQGVRHAPRCAVIRYAVLLELIEAFDVNRPMQHICTPLVSGS